MTEPQVVQIPEGITVQEYNEGIENFECSMCGKNGIPQIHHKECKICHGKAQPQKRHYTLSEEQSGRAPKDDRYREDGSVGPKIVTYLPGSGVPGGN